MDDKTILTLTLLGATLASVVVDRERRTLWALLGATLMGVLWPETALGHLDASVLGLYLGLMVLAALIRQTGISQYLALTSTKLVRGRPAPTLVIYGLLSLVLAALWGSVTAMILVVPVSLLVAVELDISPLPFVITEALAATWGSLLTCSNDPVTLLVAAAYGVDWTTWFVTVAPWIAVLAVLLFASVPLIFRRSLRVTNERRARILDFDARRSLPEAQLLLPIIFVLTVVVAGFIVSPWTHVPPTLVALAGSAVLLLVTGRTATQVFSEMDWSSWVVVASLLLLAGGVVDSGVLGRLTPILGTMPIEVLWASGILSAVFDSVTTMAILSPVAHELSGPVSGIPTWLPLVLGTGLGGGATLWGSAAALAAAGMAEKSNHKLSVWAYTRVGVGLGLAGLLITSALMLL